MAQMVMACGKKVTENNKCGISNADNGYIFLS